MRLVFALGLGLGGCFGPSYVDKVTPLAEIPDLELELRRGTGSTTLIELTFDPEQLEGCVIASPSLGGSINGAPLAIGVRGRSDRSLDGYWLGCDEPRLGTLVPVQPPGHFVVADDSLTITGEVGDALLPRAMTPVPDGPWTFAPGQTVTVRWTPASDLAAAAPVVHLDTHGVTHTFATPPATDGDLITFTMPNDARGAGRLFIYFERESEPVPCTGARCRVTFQRTAASQAISVQ